MKPLPPDNELATGRRSLISATNRKGQFDTSEVIGPGAMILQVWEAVLAA
jgi:hypothetical protein